MPDSHPKKPVSWKNWRDGQQHGLAAKYRQRTDLVTDMVQRHFAGCGIKPRKPGTGKDGKRAVVEVGFHSLRHTFVSLCRDSNSPLNA